MKTEDKQLTGNEPLQWKICLDCQARNHPKNTRCDELIAIIQKNHVMESNIERELFIANRPIVGLCHTRGYFQIMGEFFIQYTMEHIITDVDLRLIGRRLTEVIFYDSYQEYELARHQRMSNSKDQTGLNFN